MQYIRMQDGNISHEFTIRSKNRLDIEIKILYNIVKNQEAFRPGKKAFRNEMFQVS